MHHDYEQLPAHEMGNGWTRRVAVLQDGDTATNPASTSRRLVGPGAVVYETAPSGDIKAHQMSADDLTPEERACLEPAPEDIDARA